MFLSLRLSVIHADLWPVCSKRLVSCSVPSCYRACRLLGFPTSFLSSFSAGCFCFLPLFASHVAVVGRVCLKFKLPCEYVVCIPYLMFLAALPCRFVAQHSLGYCMQLMCVIRSWKDTQPDTSDVENQYHNREETATKTEKSYCSYRYVSLNRTPIDPYPR